MISKLAMTCAFLILSQSSFAENSLFVGRINDAQVEHIYNQAIRLGAGSATLHRFGNDVILKFSVENDQLFQRIMSTLARANPRQTFEGDDGQLARRALLSSLHNVRFERIRGISKDLLSLSHSATRYDYHLLPSAKSTIAFFKTCRVPSEATLITARAARAQFSRNLEIYPKGEVPQAYIHCSQLGICWCEGYGSCNNLISACTEANANWGCTQYDGQGGCISGACSI